VISKHFRGTPVDRGREGHGWEKVGRTWDGRRGGGDSRYNRVEAKGKERDREREGAEGELRRTSL
jgi:hypothetical protein